MAAHAEFHYSVYLQTIKIYQWIFSIFGLTLPPPVLNKKTKRSTSLLIFSIYIPYYMILITSAIVTSYHHSMAVYAFAHLYKLDCITGYLSYKQNFCVALVEVFVIFRTFCNRHKLMAILQLIDEIEVEMANKYDSHFRRSALKWHLLQVTGMWLAIMSIGVINFNYSIVADAMALHTKVIVLFFIVATQAKCIEYDMYLQIVNEFFECTEQALDSLIKDIELYARQGEQTVPWCQSKQLLMNQMLTNRIWILVNRLERYFAWPMLMLYYANVIAILSTMNWSYVRHIYEVKDLNQFYRVGFILILLTNLFVLCSLTERCKEKDESIALIVHNIKTKPKDVALRMRVREYSLQMKHQKLIFTCNGYMDIDYKNFGKILLVIIAYMVILVQFKLEDVHLGTKIATQHIFGTQHK